MHTGKSSKSKLRLISSAASDINESTVHAKTSQPDEVPVSAACKVITDAVSPVAVIDVSDAVIDVVSDAVSDSEINDNTVELNLAEAKEAHDENSNQPEPEKTGFHDFNSLMGAEFSTGIDDVSSWTWILTKTVKDANKQFSDSAPGKIYDFCYKILFSSMTTPKPLSDNGTRWSSLLGGQGSKTWQHGMALRFEHFHELISFCSVNQFHSDLYRHSTLMYSSMRLLQAVGAQPCRTMDPSEPHTHPLVHHRKDRGQNGALDKAPLSQTVMNKTSNALMAATTGYLQQLHALMASARVPVTTDVPSHEECFSVIQSLLQGVNEESMKYYAVGQVWDSNVRSSFPDNVKSAFESLLMVSKFLSL